MNQNQPKKTQAIGLDVGTSRIVAARQTDSEIEYDSQLNAFVSVPFSKLTENILKKEGVPHAIKGSEIMVHGNESERFADLLNTDVRRTMMHGVLNPEEPEGVRFIRDIVTSLVAQAPKGSKLCFTVPAAPLGAEENLTYHEAALREILGGFGFEVSSINEGLAVVYAELEHTNYTGIGVSCGGGLCNVCLSYLSVPIVAFSIPKAGDFIDNSAASVTGERANRVRMQKEQQFSINGHVENNLQRVLTVYYDDMIQTLVSALKSEFQRARNLPAFPRAIPLVLAGGTAMPAGFRERFEKALNIGDFPIRLSEVRLAAQPLMATAKGALISGLSDLQ